MVKTSLCMLIDEVVGGREAEDNSEVGLNKASKIL